MPFWAGQGEAGARLVSGLGALFRPQGSARGGMLLLLSVALGRGPVGLPWVWLDTAVSTALSRLQPLPGSVPQMAWIQPAGTFEDPREGHLGGVLGLQDSEARERQGFSS